MRKRLLIAGIVLVVSSVSAFTWFHYAISPVNSQNAETKIFVVQKGEALRSVATRLEQEGLIRSSLAFFLLIKKTGAATVIQAGDFKLSPSMDAANVLNQLQHGRLDTWVTILEGWRKEEVADKVQQELGINKDEFLPLAKEGYLFPDTYLIPTDASASAVISILTTNFENKTADLLPSFEKQGLSLADAVTLASIVEREGRTKEDRPVIAGILLKRLSIGQALEVDASIQYILGFQESEKTWWKKSILTADKELVSPFNTYRNAGLPPGPISNPGLVSLQAVAEPVESDYFFYIHDKDGIAHYAETLSQHNANVQKYLRN